MTRPLQSASQYTPVHRAFLGWDRPALHLSADWLLDHFNRDGDGDLSEVLVVTATRRSAARMMELLVSRAGTSGFLPPQIVTVTNLPEHLYQPHIPIAGDWVATYACMQAMMELGQNALQPLLPHIPGRDDIPDWWSLAKQIVRLDSELASACLRFDQVMDRSTGNGGLIYDEDRWHVLAQIQRAWHQLLADAGWLVRSQARLLAIERNSCRCTCPVVLAVVADLDHLTHTMLDQAGGNSTGEMQVTALVHAPATEAGGFDEIGGLITDYWHARQLEIPAHILTFVDRPQDQAMAVAESIAEYTGGERKVDPDDVTIALSDDREADRLIHTLRAAKLPARNLLGRPLDKTRPVTLLNALGAFIREHRFDNLAALLRHPDVERYVLDQCSNQCESGNDPQLGQAGQIVITEWLTLLDKYAADHLHGRLTGQWLGEPALRSRLKAVYDCLTALFPSEPGLHQPLPLWAEHIMDVLNRLYGHLTPDEDASYPTYLLVQALMRLAGHLNDLADIGAVSGRSVEVTASHAITILLSQLTGEAIADPPGTPAVELVRFREAHLDDASCLVMTSAGEGHLPASQGDHPFLPDSLKSRLGLLDSTRAYARDMMMLTAVLNSRPYVKIIAVRHDVDGRPVMPSRLLFACDDSTLKSRIRLCCDESDQPPVIILPHSPAPTGRFLIPGPDPLLPVLDRLPVTAFREYLACPYRFYLKRVCRLQSLDDHVIELDQLAFGTLAHDVLKAFGQSEWITSFDESEIFQYLDRQLDHFAGHRYGPKMKPVVRIQIEQLRLRLRRFAGYQASLAQEGWRIMPEFTEREIITEVQVDSRPFTITGRIDRIDHHPEYGYRILDYKTSDTGKSPEQVHRRRGEWIDLQLPLYLDLCRPLKLDGVVQPGYINLPKKIDNVQVMTAAWTEVELAGAMDVRDRVIRGIRNRLFWPPNDPPRYPDAYIHICADNAYDRDGLIAASSEPST